MSTSKNSHARTTIELFCRILEENEISSIRAETLRQAKFSKNDAAKQMGHLLSKVVHLCDSHNQKGRVKPLECMHSDEQRMKYIKTKLQCWGYLSHSFAKLPNDFSTGSREILLALGWVIHQQNFMDKIIQRRSNPLHQDLKCFAKSQTPSQPTEISVVRSNHDDHLSVNEKIQSHLMLTGKLRLSLRRLHSVCQHLAKLTQTIHQCTDGVSLQQRLSHLTALEVHLLRHPNSFNRMLQELEKDNLELTHLLEWKQKESIFWEWMNSVLTAHLEDLAQSSGVSSPCMVTPVDQTVYLSVPADIGRQLEMARNELRDVILGHEADMSRLEQILKTRKVSQVEAEVCKMHIDKELVQRAQQLQNCGLGEENGLSSESHLNDIASKIAASQLEQTILKSGHRPSFDGRKDDIFSPHAAKAARKAQLLKAANDEVSRLREDVDKLERDLLQTQMNNIQKVQYVIDDYENIMCIQPRSLKQFYNQI